MYSVSPFLGVGGWPVSLFVIDSEFSTNGLHPLLGADGWPMTGCVADTGATVNLIEPGLRSNSCDLFQSCERSLRR